MLFHICAEVMLFILMQQLVLLFLHGQSRSGVEEEEQRTPSERVRLVGQGPVGKKGLGVPVSLTG